MPYGSRCSSIQVAQHGPPALVVEIGTAREHNLNTLTPEAKQAAYAQAGIPEYLVYDPTGLLLPGRVRAWRLGASGEYESWEPDADGRWRSGLGISIAPETGGVLLRVYDLAGRLVPTPLELAAQIMELEAALRRQRGR